MYETPYNEMILIDIDGVFFKSPSGDTITEPDFWNDFWSDPEKHVPQEEIVQLASTLAFIAPKTRLGVGFLTARPKWTATLTTRLIIKCLRKYYPVNGIFAWFVGDSVGPDWNSSAAKVDVIQQIENSGTRVVTVIEDYKPNADAIRKVVPVLLYERTR